MMKRAISRIGMVILGIITGVCGLIAYPQLLFTHVQSGKVLQVYSDEPIDDEGAKAFIEGAEKLIANWPITYRQQSYRIFVANSTRVKSRARFRQLASGHSHGSHREYVSNL